MSGQSAPRAHVARPSVIVVSHERSGTHFLMNALAAAYGYPRDFLNFDVPELTIDYRNPGEVLRVLGAVGARPQTAVVKSHHAVEFFAPVLDRILERTPILYIHRDPVDVMVSFWRYARQWMPAESARAVTAGNFATAPPRLTVLRYQMRESATMLDRWAAHVDGWTAAAATRPRIAVVRYRDLDENYAATMAGLATTLGPAEGNGARPARHLNVVSGAAAPDLPAPDKIALRALALSRVGSTMRRHGYA